MVGKRCYNYIIVVYVNDKRDVKKVGRIINKLKNIERVRVRGVAIMVETSDPRVLGGFKSRYNVELLRNFFIRGIYGCKD